MTGLSAARKALVQSQGQGARQYAAEAPAALAEARRAEIDLGATLPPRALRHLFDHAVIHLKVVWRDLSAEFRP